MQKEKEFNFSGVLTLPKKINQKLVDECNLFQLDKLYYPNITLIGRITEIDRITWNLLVIKNDWLEKYKMELKIL